jgi:hypothetical protein
MVRTPDLTFSDVLYLPQFAFNLLLVHKLTIALNCSIIFYPSHCDFQNLKTKMMIEREFVKDGLYYFQSSSTSAPFALHSSASPYRWHSILGTLHHSISNVWFHPYLLFLILIVNSINTIKLLLNFDMMTHVYILLS